MSPNKLYSPCWLYPGILGLFMAFVSIGCTAGTPSTRPESLASEPGLPAP
jgi:hypothetical protein